MKTKKNYKSKESIRIEPYKNLRKTNISKPEEQIEQLEPYKTIRINREQTEQLNKGLREIKKIAKVQKRIIEYQLQTIKKIQKEKEELQKDNELLIEQLETIQNLFRAQTVYDYEQDCI